MKSQTLIDFSKVLGCALMVPPKAGSEGGSRQYYYYHRLLQFTQSVAKGSIHLSVILFRIMSVFFISNKVNAQKEFKLIDANSTKETKALAKNLKELSEKH